MLNVVGLVFNLVGAFFLAYNEILATNRDVARKQAHTWSGETHQRNLRARLRSQVGFAYIGIGFCFQFAHEIFPIDKSWSLVWIAILLLILPSPFGVIQMVTRFQGRNN